MLLKTSGVTADQLSRLTSWLSSYENRLQMPQVLKHVTDKEKVSGKLFVLINGEWEEGSSAHIIELVCAERKSGNNYLVTVEVPGMITWHTRTYCDHRRPEGTANYDIQSNGEIPLPPLFLVSVHNILACK